MKIGHSQATRDTNNEAINAIASVIPYFLGGSADLSHSNKTNIKNGGDFSKVTPDGRNIYFGVREFAMASIFKRNDVTWWSTCLWRNILRIL